MDVNEPDPMTTPADPERRSLTAAAVVIVAGILVELALLAMIPVFVTTDGAAHVDGAAALARLAFGPASPVDGYTTISWLPATNLIPELPMAAVAAVLGAPRAEVFVLAAWVILLPASLWYAVSGVRAGAGWLAVLALPLTFGLMLQLGFYSFIFGALLFLVVVGYHARHRDRLGGAEIAVLAVLLTLTYAAHAFVFAVALLVLAVLEGWTWLIEPPRTARGLGRRAGTVVLAGLPGVLLVVAGVLLGPKSAAAGVGNGTPLIAFQIRALLESVTMILQLVVFDQREAVFAVLVGGLLAGLAIVGLRGRLRGRGLRPRPADGYLAVVAVLLLAILFVPDATTLGAGGAGAFVTSRLSLFVMLAGILWIASHPFGSWARGATITVAVVAAVGLAGMRIGWYQTLSDHATAFASVAPCVADGATMAQVNLSRVELPSSRTDQIGNETGRVTAVTSGLDLGDAELGDHVHLVRYRAGLDPYRYLRDPGGLPTSQEPVIDPEGYGTSTGGELDYVLLFGRSNAAAETLASAEWQQLQADLAASYRRVAVADGGLLEVYERLGTPAADRGAARRAAAAGACGGQADSASASRS